MIEGVTSIVIPTNKPVEFVQATLASLASEPDVEPVVVVDKPGIGYDVLPVKVYYNEGVGAIAAWNTGLKNAHGQYIVIGADDLKFHPGSLEIAKKAHREVLDGYGVIGLNDLHHDGVTHTTHFFFDVRFCREKLGGVLAYPCYRFFCNDNEILERAKLAGHYHYCKESIVEHLHPSNNKRAFVGNEAERSENITADIALFYERRAARFPNNFEPVI